MMKALWNLSLPPLAVLASGVALPALMLSLMGPSTEALAADTKELSSPALATVTPIRTKCVGGRVEVTYESEAGSAKTEIWSDGHPMTCEAQDMDRFIFGTINGREYHLSESREIIYSAIHQHLIVRTAKLEPVSHGPDYSSSLWDEHDKITAHSLSKALQLISEVDIKDINKP